MRHRFVENAETIDVEASGTEFHVHLSGGTAHGDVFVPYCTADRGEKLHLRIRLGEGSFKAVGRVAHVRGHGPVPGCGVAWYATGQKGYDVVHRWLENRERVT